MLTNPDTVLQPISEDAIQRARTICIAGAATNMDMGGTTGFGPSANSTVNGSRQLRLADGGIRRQIEPTTVAESVTTRRGSYSQRSSRLDQGAPTGYWPVVGLESHDVTDHYAVFFEEG
jgi:hypothetical protein